MKIAVYPGSFDPITNGHLEILRRSLKVFDKVVVLIAINKNKKSRFSVEERLLMIKESIKGLKNVSVDYTDGLTVKYCKKIGASHIIRGLRAVSDFEYEFKMAEGNRFLDKDIDMVFFMADTSSSFISSSIVDELAKDGVDISKLVPAPVKKAYKKR